MAWYLATLLALFLALRLFWGWEAARGLQAIEREIRAIEIPPEPTHPNSAGPGNPVTLLARAAADVHLTSADESLPFTGDFPGAPDIQWAISHKARLQAILVNQKPVFDELDAAMHSTEPRIFNPNAILSGYYQLARLLRDDALLLHDDHQDAGALHRTRQMLFIARTVDGDATFLAQTLATACRLQACDTLERLLTDLQPSTSDVTAQELSALARDLPRPAAADAANVLATKRMAVSIDDIRETYVRSPDSWWIRPLRDDGLTYILRDYQLMIGVAEADNWQLAYSRFKAIPTVDYPPQDNSLLNEFTRWNLITTAGFLPLRRFECQAAARAVTMLLAAEMFKQQHGQYPTSAAELTPEFLPTVPVDPFSTDHQPMHYRLDPNGPTAWSVDENGMDNRAVTAFNRAGVKLSRIGMPPNKQLDIVYGAAWNPPPMFAPDPPPKPAKPPARTRPR